MKRCLVLLAFSVLCFGTCAQIVNPDSLLFLQSDFDALQLSLPKFKADSFLKIKTPSDSLPTLVLKPNDQLNRTEQRLNSLQHSLQAKLDSLTKLPQPDTLATKMIARSVQSDSLQMKISGLRNKVKLPDKLQE